MRCRVSYVDLTGIEHACEVEAYSTMEAAGLAIARFRRMPRAEPDDIDIADPTSAGHTRLTIEYREPGAERTVTRKQFDEWLARTGRSPREIMCRARVREALEEKPQS